MMFTSITSVNNIAGMIVSSLLLPFFIVVQSSLASDDFFPISNEGEKIYRSAVSLNTVGTDPLLLMNEKNSLERSFQIAYEGFTQYPNCALRSLKDVSLVDIRKMRIDNYDPSLYEEDESHYFSLHFEMLLSCFDCPLAIKNKILFNDSSGTRDRRGLQSNNYDNSCYWSNYHLDATLYDNSAAPSTTEFLEEFIKVVMSNKKLSSIVREGLSIVEDTRTISSRNNDESLPCRCPSKSFCSYTDKWQKNFWKVRGITSELFFNCTCRDGFVGKDGWRCEMVNECDDPDNWPCASPSEGGFCVNAHPDDTEHPMYKCGCQSPDFVPDERYPIDGLHGVKHCKSTLPASVENSPEEKDDGIANEIQNTKISDGCLEVENGIPGLIFINVTGNPETVFNDTIALEQSIKTAYEEALGTPCVFRSLTDVSLLGIILENQFIENENAKYATNVRNRFLEDRQDIADEANAISDTDDTSVDYLNDDDNFEVELSFNFTIFFSLIMRCYGCPDDALLFNDASRRELLSSSSSFLRTRQLQEEESICTCQIGDEVIKDSFNVAPSIITFLQQFQNITERPENNITSIQEVTSAEEKTNDNSVEDIIEKSCFNDNRCNTNNQECVQGVCLCKPGYIAPSGRGGNCIDREECKFGIAKCHRDANCIELQGSYDCRCKPGYDGDGFDSCSDVDECVLNIHDCGIGDMARLDVCINQRGGYHCAAPTSPPTRKPTPRVTPYYYPTVLSYDYRRGLQQRHRQ